MARSGKRASGQSKEKFSGDIRQVLAKTPIAPDLLAVLDGKPTRPLAAIRAKRTRQRRFPLGDMRIDERERQRHASSSWSLDAGAISLPRSPARYSRATSADWVIGCICTGRT
jgi:hypothetical protein